MIYKEYGKTGIKVSALGFGGMRFRREDYEKDPMICAEIVRHANRLGINYFDTAPGYCDDMSEKIFGLAFRDMPGAFFVSTKSSIMADKTADDVRRRCELSLERMGVGKISFFHMWNVLNFPQYRKVMAPGGPYEGALRLKEEGLVGHICISTHMSGDEIRRVAEEGAYEGILLGYNASNFAYREEGLRAAYGQGMGVVTMNPLGGGMIPQNPSFFAFLKDGTDDTIAQAALRFNISHREIAVTLSGMGSIAEVDENVPAADSLAPIRPERLDGIRRHLRESLNFLCTGCGYCDSCPAGIPIPKFMEAYNRKIMTGEDGATTGRLKYYWGVKKKEALQCTACGQCETLCTQHLPIIERLKIIGGMP